MNNSNILKNQIQNAKINKQSDYDRSKIIQHEIDKSNLNLIDTSTSMMFNANSVYYYDNININMNVKSPEKEDNDMDNMSFDQSHIVHVKDKDQDDTLNFMMDNKSFDYNLSDKLSLGQSAHVSAIKVNRIDFIEHNHYDLISGGYSNRSNRDTDNLPEIDIDAKKYINKTIFNSDCNIQGIDTKGLKEQLVNSFNINANRDNRGANN